MLKEKEVSIFTTKYAICAEADGESFDKKIKRER